MNKIGTLTFFSAYYPPHTGGVERYVRSLAQNLHSKGVKVFVVTSGQDETGGITDDGGITVIRLPVRDLISGRYPVFRNNQSSRELKEYIRTIDSDIYVSNMRIYHSTFLGKKVARIKKKPHIIIEHVTGHFSVNNPLLDYIGRVYEHIITYFAKKGARAFYGVSAACSCWLGHFGIESAGIIPNGVSDPGYDYFSMRDELGIGSEKIMITYAGRLIEEKGIKLLAGAFEKLCAKNPDVVLVIAGNGKLEEFAGNISAESGGKVVYAGSLSHNRAVNLLKDSDIAVNPSYYPEGLPTLLLEAGLYDCPVIATDCGGTRELIINDETGILIEPRNETALLCALERLAGDSGLRKQLALNFHKKVISEFSWDRIADLFLFEMNKYV